MQLTNIIRRVLARTTVRILAIAFALVCLVPRAVGQHTTWVVDPTGTTGQFTQLSVAVAAVSSGDKIVVLGGNHGTVTVTRGITIVGAAQQFGVAVLNVSGVPAGEVATVCNFTANRVEVSSNDGTVLLTDAHITYGTPWGTSSALIPVVSVNSTEDARLHSCLIQRFGWGSASGGDGVWCSASRLEMYNCTSSGGLARNGQSLSTWVCSDYCPNCAAPTGGNGLVCSDQGRLHLVISHFKGGDGADERILSDGGIGGGFYTCGTGGGTGIVCQNAVVVGVDAQLGHRGYHSQNPVAACSPCYGTSQGWGVVGAIFRQSGSRLRVAPGTSAPAALPRDPMLDLIGTPNPGGMVTLRVKGKAGSRLRFEEGAPAVVNDGLNEIERLTTATNVVSAGNIPLSSDVSFSWLIPATATPGDVTVVQAVQTDPSTGVVIGRTNSIALIVR